MITFSNKVQFFEPDDLAGISSAATSKQQQEFLSLWTAQGGHKKHWREFDLLSASDILPFVALIAPEADDLIAQFVGNALVGKHENVGLETIQPKSSIFSFKDKLPKAFMFLEQAAKSKKIAYLHEEPAHFPGLSHVKFSYLGVPLLCDVPSVSSVLSFISYQAGDPR